MKHEPYRSWLLQEEPLAAEQRSALKTHLERCEPCRQFRVAWDQVHARLTEAPEIGAPQGFSARFVARLRSARRGRSQRQVWAIFLLTLLGSLGAVALLTAALLNNMGSGFAGLLKQLLVVQSQVSVLGEFLLRALEIAPYPARDLLGVSLLVAATGAAVALYASLGALWAAAVFQFANPRLRYGGSR